VSAGRAEPTAPFCSLAPGILTRKKMAQLIYALKNVNIQTFDFKKRRKNSSKRRTLTRRINEYSCDLTGNFRSCFAKVFTSAGFPVVSRPKYADKCTQTNDSDFDFTRYYGHPGVNRGLPVGLKMLGWT
jgi:hypothetical protein